MTSKGSHHPTARFALWISVVVAAVAEFAGAQGAGTPPRTLAELGDRTFVAGAYGGSLRAALAAIGDEPATLVVNATLVCEAPTIPANVELVVPRGGLVSLGADPLLVEGTLSAGRYAIFSPAGTVTGLKDPCPEWFGAGGLGATDDTAAVQRAIDSVGDRAGSRLILGGRYAVTSLLVNRFGFTIESENAWLVARPGPSDYLLRFAPGAHSSTITGNLFIDLDYNLGYGCAINVNARHFTAHNVNMWRCPLGWLIGDPKWATSGIPGDAERGDSEIEIIGGSTAHCLRAVEAVGANTIVKFTGALLYSFPWSLRDGDPRKAAWEAADCTAIRAIGALIYIDSGAIANFNTIPLIDVQPIATTNKEYFSEYGKVFVNSAHVEGGNFFAATNPRGIVSAGRSNSLSMLGCNGYLSSDNPVVTTDPLFLGGVLIQNCGFYRAGRKSVIAVIGNREATVNIDTRSFFDASPKGLNAVRGGTQKFTDRMILHVRKAAQTIHPGGDVVKFVEFDRLPDGADFEACYDPSTGVFTCPYGGLVNVTVRAAMAVATGKPTDVSLVEILRNGTPLFYRKVAGLGAEIEYTIPELMEADRVAVRMHSPAGRTLDGGGGNSLQITASRY
ncbi:MAG: hypothetical protein HYU66_10060 [Armatimonadetes bacterium]|nr:hypothetical protein [Armatimonadota bacterium]